MAEITLDELTAQINGQLENAALFYLSNDPERALGLEKLLKNYHLVHIDNSYYTDFFRAAGLPFFCLEEKTAEFNGIFRSSLRLLRHPLFAEYLRQHQQARHYLQTFKISRAFFLQAEKMHFQLCNTSAELNQMFEDKLQQISQLAKLQISLPKYAVTELGALSYAEACKQLGTDFVVQYARGHTGSGTVFIHDEDSYLHLQKAFPARTVRISEFIPGDPYTVNGCITGKGIYLGGLSFQITGIPELTAAAGGTVGNDWKYPEKLPAAIKQNVIRDLQIIGELMRSQGYQGLFGVDFIVNDKGHAIIEINARQPASIPMYTKMQLQEGQIPLSMLHLAEFFGLDWKLDVQAYNEQSLSPKSYSQIFLRSQTLLTIMNAMQMGSYTRDNSQLKFVDKAYAVDEIKDPVQEFLVLPAIQGKTLRENQEIARLQLPEGIINSQKQIEPWVLAVLLTLKQNLLQS